MTKERNEKGLKVERSGGQEDPGEWVGRRVSAAGVPVGLPSSEALNGREGSPPPKSGLLKRVGSARNGKCRCWCCCCSCSCLALKNGESRSGGKEAESDLNPEPEPPPSLEEIRSWGESFDHLMRSSGGRRVFRDFLKCEYSEENILFWLAVEELRTEKSPEAIEEKARLIYEDYISILSPKEVSLDSRVRELVNQNMKNPRPETFDEAQVQIYTLMHRDSYPRFVNSPLYKRLAQLNSTTPTTPPTASSPSSRKTSTVPAPSSSPPTTATATSS